MPWMGVLLEAKGFEVFQNWGCLFVTWALSGING